MNKKLITEKHNLESCIQNKVLHYKMKGYDINDIVVKLSEKYELRSILGSLLSDKKYRMHTIIHEQIIVIDENNNSTDGIDMLKCLIGDFPKN